jgi:hypothetical protein
MLNTGAEASFVYACNHRFPTSLHLRPYAGHKNEWVNRCVEWIATLEYLQCKKKLGWRDGMHRTMHLAIDRLHAECLVRVVQHRLTPHVLIFRQ